MPVDMCARRIERDLAVALGSAHDADAAGCLARDRYSEAISPSSSRVR